MSITEGQLVIAASIASSIIVLSYFVGRYHERTLNNVNIGDEHPQQAMLDEIQKEVQDEIQGQNQ